MRWRGEGQKLFIPPNGFSAKFVEILFTYLSLPTSISKEL
jgi:hypothetical protein